MCSETSPPRLSFDRILCQDHPHNLQPRRDTAILELNCDFEFSINICSDQESSSADELFSHGVILPIQPRDRVSSTISIPSKKTQNREIPSLNSLPPLPWSEYQSKGEKLKEVSTSDFVVEQSNKPQSTKSFWGTFKRSNSLNHENKRSLLCSLPLLSRSNSTGSVSSTQKKSSSLKEPPLKKNYGGGFYGNGVRIIPVLNVPPPYIPKGTAKLFGFGKDRKSKK
uniref:Uncharacterized protein n=1 Tax=Cannabis sativa TaxID=3483 RepID=A0A803PB39_CANSA